ncbi:hypothetical protein O6H91_02G061800 [Diphasiastrum complanatum]|uniref:Uncharacterized protein n=1 Tax=Diphasiastrum complanatum TaxID=34168 RepID=A0ACC2EGM0_DIPCM|nr:hypothetical protein O6H91_02G061800 [Diphasiastrum complanatum]
MDHQFPLSSSNGSVGHNPEGCSSMNHSITTSLSGVSAAGVAAPVNSSPDVSSSSIAAKAAKASKGEKASTYAGLKGSGRKGGGRSKKRFVGVRQRPSGRWVAEIKDTTQKIRLWLGTFDTAEDAARAYDEAACLLRGSNTRTNFLPETASAVSVLPSKAARLLHLRRSATATATAAAAAKTQPQPAPSPKSQQNPPYPGCASLLPPATTQPLFCSNYSYDNHHGHLDTAKRQQESLVTLLKTYRERYYGSTMCPQETFTQFSEDDLGSTQFLCRKELPSSPKIEFCTLIDNVCQRRNDDNLPDGRYYANADSYMSEYALPHRLDNAGGHIESPFEFCTEINMPKSLNDDLPNEPTSPALDYANSEDDESSNSDSFEHNSEENNILREHLKRIMYERQSSASLYLLNGVQECLLLSNNATSLPYAMSSPSLSLPPSFYAQHASQSAKTSTSMWEARINRDQQQMTISDHEPNTSVDNPSQEAMWNSWDLSPLCIASKVRSTPIVGL